MCAADRPLFTTKHTLGCLKFENFLKLFVAQVYAPGKGLSLLNRKVQTNWLNTKIQEKVGFGNILNSLRTIRKLIFYKTIQRS